MTKVIGDYTAAVTIDGSTHYLLIQPGSSSTAYNRINRNTLLGVTGQPADLTTIQTFQSKVFDNSNTITVKDTLLTLQDNADTTKQAKFELSSITTATTRTYTLPDATTTIVGTGTTQTLTNKTLTSPTITGGTYDNGTITVDAIGGHTSANIVTVAGLQINNGALNTNNSVVTANITDSAVTPAKLQSGTGSGWSWTSYVPAIINLVVGNGTLFASYSQTGKTVSYKGTFQMGSTSSITGNISIPLPVAARNDTFNALGVSPIGDCILFDSGVNQYGGVVYITSTTTMSLQTLNASGTYATSTTVVNATIPFTFSTSDGFAWCVSYEVA